MTGPSEASLTEARLVADFAQRGWRVFRNIAPLSEGGPHGAQWEVAHETYAAMRRSSGLLEPYGSAYSWSTATPPFELRLFGIVVRPTIERTRHELVLVVQA